MVTTLLFLVSGLAAWAADPLPNDVYTKTHEQSFSSEYYYALQDGKLWIKPNTQLSGQKGDWTLFQGTGFPFGKNAKSFGPKNRIVEFSTEALMVVARA